MMSISLIRGSMQHGMQHAYLNNGVHFCHFFQSFQLISVKMHNRMSSNQSKRRKISISTKIEIVEFLQTPGSSLNKAMEKFQVSRGTVQRAKRQTTELMYQKENNKNAKLTRLHHETPLNTFCLSMVLSYAVARFSHFVLLCKRRQNNSPSCLILTISKRQSGGCNHSRKEIV